MYIRTCSSEFALLSNLSVYVHLHVHLCLANRSEPTFLNRNGLLSVHYNYIHVHVSLVDHALTCVTLPLNCTVCIHTYVYIVHPFDPWVTPSLCHMQILNWLYHIWST